VKPANSGAPVSINLWRSKMTNNQINKQMTIKKILENTVYKPDSGLIKRLQSSLGNLPLSDLSGLLVVIYNKSEMRD
jgi:hypothetical protein